MKSTLKLLILIAMVAIGGNLSAQVTLINDGLIVNNNTPLANGTVDFNYVGGCGPISFTLPPFTTQMQKPVPCLMGNFSSVVITFSDLSCTPAALVYTITLDAVTPNFTYTDCMGIPRLFSLTFAAPDIIVDIN